MATPLLYRPMPRWQVAAAFAAAVAIHAAAVGIAALKDAPPPIMDLAQIPEAVEMSLEEEAPQPTPPPEEPVPEPEPEEPPPPVEQPEFVDEKPTPTPRPKTDAPPKPIAPIQRPSTGAPKASGPVPTGKAAMVYKPNIQYPYEARRARATGSGVVVVQVSPSGSVTSATMGQSTGNAILDNASTTAMRSARFRPGTPPTVRIPITWTLSGARL